MRKPRSDSRLLNLPHHQQDALTAWLLDEGLSYTDAREKLHMDFNVQTSEAALGSFWERVCAPRQFARVAEASQAAPALSEGLENNFALTTEAYVRQHYFVLMASRNPDPKLLAVFAEQVGALDRGGMERAKLRTKRSEIAVRTRLKRKDQALSQAKFNELLRKNAEARERLNQVVQSKGGLTAETISQIEEALKLL